MDLKLIGLVLVSCNIGIILAAEKRNYQGYQILRVKPPSDSRRTVLKRIIDQRQPDLELLSPMDTLKWLDILTSPKALDDFVEVMHLLHIPLESVIPDLPQVISRQLYQNEQLEKSEIQDGVFRLDRYHTLDEIETWLHSLEREHPQTMEIIQLGTSYEGRPIFLTKISSSVNKAVKKPAIWLDAGIHSNEWVGPATMLYFIQNLVDGSEESLGMLEAFDWYVLPVFNVDGYEYTWAADRLWRKSRSVPFPDSGCVGVDLNRNWSPSPHQQSRNPCSRTFPGVQPMSEPETQAVAGFLNAHNDTILAYLAYHSFSQMWMTPYGFSNNSKPDNYEELIDMALEISSAIHSIHGTNYEVGAVSDLIGKAPGSSIDYTYGQLGIRYSFGIELRDLGRYGTLLPPDQILPNCEESWAGLVKMAELLKDKAGIDKRIPPDM